MNNYRGSVDRCNPGGGGCCWGKKSTRAKQASRTEWPGFPGWLIRAAVRIAKKMTAVMVEKRTEFGCWGRHD